MSDECPSIAKLLSKTLSTSSSSFIYCHAFRLSFLSKYVITLTRKLPPTHIVLSFPKRCSRLRPRQKCSMISKISSGFSNVQVDVCMDKMAVLISANGTLYTHQTVFLGILKDAQVLILGFARVFCISFNPADILTPTEIDFSFRQSIYQCLS